MYIYANIYIYKKLFSKIQSINFALALETNFFGMCLGVCVSDPEGQPSEAEDKDMKRHCVSTLLCWEQCGCVYRTQYKDGHNSFHQCFAAHVLNNYYSYLYSKTSLTTSLSKTSLTKHLHRFPYIDHFIWISNDRL